MRNKKNQTKEKENWSWRTTVIKRTVKGKENNKKKKKVRRRKKNRRMQ